MSAWFNGAHRPWLLGAAFLALASPVLGQISSSIDSAASPSGTSTSPLFVIDSDATNDGAGYDRDKIQASADVRFSRPLSSSSASSFFRLTAQLLDSEGDPVILEGGITTAFSTATLVSFGTAAAVQTFTWSLEIDPRDDLGAGDQYRVSYRIQRGTLTSSGGTFLLSWTDDTPPTVSSPFTVVHFRDAPEVSANRNVRGYLRGAPTFSKTFAVSSGSGTQSNFSVQVPYALGRYDLGGSTLNVPARFTVTMTDDLGNPVPLQNSGVMNTTFSRSATLSGGVGNPVIPHWISGTTTVSFRPQGQLDSRNRTYRVTVAFSHEEAAGQPYFDNGSSPESTLQRLLHFNGQLNFGSVATTFTGISNAPAVGTLGSGFVNTTLDPSGTTFPGFPGYQLGSGAVLDVQLASSGVATVTAGQRDVLASGGADVSSTFGGVKVSYPGTRVGPSGATASSAVVHFPQGLSYTPNRASSAGRYRPDVTIAGSRSLTSQFRHSGSLSLSLGTNAWVFDEARPLLFQVTDFEMPTNGDLNFTSVKSEWAHQAAFDRLEAQEASGEHAFATMSYRLSNDGYLRFTEIPGTATLRFGPAPDGSARTNEAVLTAKPGRFRTMFPHDVEVVWNDAGSIEIANGFIRPGSSVLRGVDPVTVAYDGSCDGDTCGPPAGSAAKDISLTPASAELFITPEGGLWAHGAIPGSSLAWGIRSGAVATHRSPDFTEGGFLAAGWQLYESSNPLAKTGPAIAQSALLGPAIALLAGFDDDALEAVYPQTAGYRDGIGDWPGLTLTVHNGGESGEFRIADMASAEPLLLQEDATKYYIRRSGLSGRHVATENGFPAKIQLYGYDFGLERFQLAFLSNGPPADTPASWINGQVSVPEPSAFEQRFLELRLSCVGALESAEIDPDDNGAKPLNYWSGSFIPVALRFAPQTGAGCYSDRFLTIGLIGGAANIDTPLAGSLAFLPSGNIATPGDAVEGADGRLGLPPTLPVKGPGDELYQLAPVTRLYYNNPDNPQAPTNGFVSFAATCDVPFFQDLKLHVMTSAQAGVPAPIHFTAGWNEGGQTHFSNARFDSGNRGLPPGVTAAAYREPAAVNSYVVRAQQELFGIVELNYPLRWNPTGRYFKSWDAIENDLLVINVEHQVDYMSARNVELSFGAQYDGLPQINLVSTAIDIVDEQIGAAKALTDAARGFVTDALNEGVDEIGHLIEDTADELLDQALGEMETTVLDPLYNAVRDSYNQAVLANQTYSDWVNDGSDGLRAQFDIHFDGSIGGAAATVQGRLEELAAATEEASSIIRRVDEAVEAGILAIDAIAGRIQVVSGETVFNLELPPGATIPSSNVGNVTNGIINGLLAEESGPGGVMQRQIVQKLVGALIQELAPPDLASILNPLLEEATSELNGELNALLSEFDPTLDRITEVLLEARGYLVTVKQKLEAGGDIIESFQEIIDSASTEIDTVVAQARQTAHDFIDRMAAGATIGSTTALDEVGSLLDEFTPEAFVAAIKAELKDRLMEALFVQRFQYVLRQYISEFDLALRSAIDSAFQEVNRMCRELIKEALGPIDDAINGLIGDINSYVGAGSVDGYAHIQGDTLRRLRLDAQVQLKVPDEMELKAYFEMVCYDSSSTTGAAGCLSPGEQVVEVSIGALDVPMDWISPDLRVNLEIWFSMNSGPVYPRGVGGSLTMTGGELDFQSFKITGFSAAVAVGIDECYLAASARVIVSSYEAAGGIFFGRTCSLEPLAIVDPDAASILGDPPFTGAYVYGEVWIPISEVVLGIPASCLFRISAGVGAGAFYFVEGPTFGGKMLLGVSGEALCIVSIRGELAMTGVMSGGSLRFNGRGTLTGKAGWCPFCLKFTESAKVTYQDGSWSVDL